MEYNAKLVNKVSKDGQPYLAIEIELTPNYKKLVFLSTAEKELLSIVEKKGR